MCADVLNVIAAGTQIAAAIAIAVFQYKQTSDMNDFTRRQDVRDEKRYHQQIHSHAIMFLKDGKHVDDRQLLPLCVIADTYSPVHPYRRDIYKDYCCLPDDVKDEVLAINNITFRKELINYPAGKQFYELCLNALLCAYKRYLPNEKNLDNVTMFYEGGKYLYYAMDYGKERVPDYFTDIDREHKRFKVSSFGRAFEQRDYMGLKDHITNELAYYHDEQPVSDLTVCPVWTATNPNRVNFGTGDILLACYEANIVAQYIAIFYANSLYQSHTENEDGCNDYYIGDYNEQLYFEDLFLETLFELFDNLVKGQDTKKFQKEQNP